MTEEELGNAEDKEADAEQHLAAAAPPSEEPMESPPTNATVTRGR